MAFGEFIPLFLSGVGVVFMFGKQANAIAVLKRDVDNISASKREILAEIRSIHDAQIRLESKLDHLINP